MQFGRTANSVGRSEPGRILNRILCNADHHAVIVHSGAKSEAPSGGPLLWVHGQGFP
jgi:hypothetical protein